MREGNVTPGLPVRAQPGCDVWAGRSRGARSLGRRDLRKRAGCGCRLFVQDLEQLLNKNLEQPIILNFFWILVSNCSQPDPGGHCHASGGTQRLSFQNENFFLGCSRFFWFRLFKILNKLGRGRNPTFRIPGFGTGQACPAEIQHSLGAAARPLSRCVQLCSDVPS